MFRVFDEENNLINCEVLFTFNENDKDFIVYVDDNDQTLASYYKECNDKIIIFPINNDEDFDIVDRELTKRNI